MNIAEQKEKENSIHVQKGEVAIPELAVEDGKESSISTEDDAKELVSNIDYNCAIPEIHIK